MLRYTNESNTTGLADLGGFELRFGEGQSDLAGSSALFSSNIRPRSPGASSSNGGDHESASGQSPYQSKSQAQYLRTRTRVLVIALVDLRQRYNMLTMCDYSREVFSLRGDVTALGGLNIERAIVHVLSSTANSLPFLRWI